MVKPLMFMVAALSVVALGTGCERGSVAMTTGEIPLPPPDAGGDDVWPPGPGPGPGEAAAEAPVVAEVPPLPPPDAGGDDVWPPGPGPGEAAPPVQQ